MNDMREIVTMEQANHWILVLAIVLPIVGTVIGGAFGARNGLPIRGALKGFLVGLVGPLNLILWKVYNVITDRLGLDSVKNLLVNLALFAGIGIVGALVYNWLSRRGGDGFAGVGANAGGPAPVAAGSASRPEESGQPPREP